MKQLITVFVFAMLASLFNPNVAQAKDGPKHAKIEGATTAKKATQKVAETKAAVEEEEVEAPDTVWRCTFTFSGDVQKSACKPYLYNAGKRRPIKIGKKEKVVAEQLQKMLARSHNRVEYPIKQLEEEGGTVSSPVNCSVEISRTFGDEGYEKTEVNYLSGTCATNKYAYIDGDGDVVRANTEFVPWFGFEAIDIMYHGKMAEDLSEEDESDDTAVSVGPHALILEHNYTAGELYEFLKSKRLKGAQLDVCWRGDTTGIFDGTMEEPEIPASRYAQEDITVRGRHAPVIWSGFTYRPEVIEARKRDRYTGAYSNYKLACQIAGRVSRWDPYECKSDGPRPLSYGLAISHQSNCQAPDEQYPTFRKGQAVWVEHE